MHSTPKPMNIPADAGAAQWILDVKPVQPNLKRKKVDAW